jgi:hypothetical protein
MRKAQRRGGVSARNYVLHLDVVVRCRLLDEDTVEILEAKAADRTLCNRESAKVNRAGCGHYSIPEFCRECWRRTPLVR